MAPENVNSIPEFTYWIYPNDRLGVPQFRNQALRRSSADAHHASRQCIVIDRHSKPSQPFVRHLSLGSPHA